MSLCRFIPAGAGNTRHYHALRLVSTVYPRWRGEHPAYIHRKRITAGLSPLARGTPGYCQHDEKQRRFIPAGAGNTDINGRGQRTHAVYPRWRGEHVRPDKTIISPSGLSPLARGTQERDNAVNVRLRFIPAGAGNTPGRGTYPPTDSVYPRWRGEHIFSAEIVIKPVGLSPLARGTLHRVAQHDRVKRFIPAGAGNTGSQQAS